MRFMYIVTSPQPDKGPSPALMEAMGKLADREIKAGRMLDTGGLMPIAMAGAQVRITDNKLGVIDGPFVETKELIGGYAIFELRDTEEAVAGREGVHAAAPRAHAGLGRHLRSSRAGDPGRGRRLRGRHPRPRLMRGVRQVQSAAMTAADVHRTILAVWRIEQPRLITGLSRMLRDVTLAEDLTQEALVAALEHWPATRRAGKARRVADGDRQTPRARSTCAAASMLARKHEMLIRDLEQEQQAMPDPDAGAGRRYRRRAAAADIHRLPSADCRARRAPRWRSG